MGCTYKVENNQPTSARYQSNRPSASSSAQSKYNTIKSHINLSMNKNKMTKEEEDELIDYLISIGKRTTGLQDKVTRLRPPSEYNSSYNLNHPEFNRDQRLYLNNLCSVYSIKDLKTSKVNKYMSILQKQKAIGKLT